MFQMPGELARICRVQASFTANPQTRECLLEMASEYEAEARRTEAAARSFYDEPPGTFRNGHVLRSRPDLDEARRHGGNGYWKCHVADGDRLEWSREVFGLFDLPEGSAVDREWAVSRYSDQSRATLTSVRTQALDQAAAFLLDAQVERRDGGYRWIRVLAVPTVEHGRVTQLHGVKRAL